MLHQCSMRAITLAGVLCAAMAGMMAATISTSWAWDDSKYPNFRGQWRTVGGPGRFARDQVAPLTPEYQAIFDEIKGEGGQGSGVTGDVAGGVTGSNSALTQTSLLQQASRFCLPPALAGGWMYLKILISRLLDGLIPAPW